MTIIAENGWELMSIHVVRQGGRVVATGIKISLAPDKSINSAHTTLWNDTLYHDRLGSRRLRPKFEFNIMSIRKVVETITGYLGLVLDRVLVFRLSYLYVEMNSFG